MTGCAARITKVIRNIKAADVTKARLRVHDISRANHQAVVDTLKDALERSRSHDIDGAIVILTDRHGTPYAKVSGRLSKTDKAVLQLLKLQMAMAIDDQ